LGVPSTTALTRRMLGFHVLLERRWEWLTFMPKETPFPQISHFAISISFLSDTFSKIAENIITETCPFCNTFFENFLSA